MTECSTLLGAGDNIEDVIPKVQTRIESYTKVNNGLDYGIGMSNRWREEERSAWPKMIESHLE